MNPRTTGILLLVTLALGAFVWFYEIEGEEGRLEAEAAEKLLFPGLEAEAVESVSLDTRDGVAARLERSETGWTLAEPLRFPADAFAADGLASNLAELASELVLEDPAGPEEYGLADGARVVRFRADGEEHALRVGDKTPIGSNSYAQVEGRDDVVTIATYRATSFDKSLTDLRERRILDVDTSAVERVEARWPGGGVTLVRSAPPAGDAEEEDAAEEASTWRLSEPLDGRADDETVEGLLSNLAFLRADGFVDEPTDEVLAGFAEPEYAVVLHGAAGEGDDAAPTWSLRVGPLHEGDKRLVQGAHPSLYTVPAERLSDFPREVVAYRFKRLSDFALTEAAQVDFFFHPAQGDPVAVTAVRGDDGWESSPEALAPGKVARLVSELATLEAKDIVSESASEEELQALGLAPPRTILTVFAEAPADAEEGAGLPRLAEIHLGDVEGSEWIVARAAGDPAVYRLGYELAEHVPVSLEAFRNRFLGGEEPGAGVEPEGEPGNGPDFLTPSEESP
ncbi:MAG: DUF4340 domain-containing protein [Myxococcota bacterium]